MICRIEKKERDFTQISNQLLNDENISFKSKGLLCYLLSKPNDWIVSVTQIMNKFKVGKDFVYTCFDELIKEGYVERVTVTAAGKFVRTEYKVKEEKKPLPDFPEAVQPEVVFADTTNTIIHTNTVFNKEKNKTEKSKVENLSINRWINKNLKRVPKMPEQITFEQYNQLITSGYTPTTIKETLKYMDNRADFNKYISVYERLTQLLKNKKQQI